MYLLAPKTCVGTVMAPNLFPNISTLRPAHACYYSTHILPCLDYRQARIPRFLGQSLQARLHPLETRLSAPPRTCRPIQTAEGVSSTPPSAIHGWRDQSTDLSQFTQGLRVALETPVQKRKSKTTSSTAETTDAITTHIHCL